MDTATQLVKGVYRSVEEFLNNTPSIEKAELTTDKTGGFELLISDENGQLYYTRKVWGYCDGSRTYLMIDGNLFPLFSICHQFYVLGSKEFQLKKKVSMVPFVTPVVPVLLFSIVASGTDTRLIRSLRVYRVDTGTGQVVD